MFRGVEGGALSFPLPCLFIKINFSNNLGIQALKRFARFGTICTILKNMKNTHGAVILLVNFTKIITPPWVFFMFFKIVQMVPNRA